MQNTLNYLNPSQQEELTHAIQKITTETNAVSIYCFGHRTTQKLEWGLFNSGQSIDNNNTVTYYDLLLVIPDSDIRRKEKIEGIVNRPFTKHTRFCYHAISCLCFNELLKDGNPFINKICCEGILLHNSDRYHLIQSEIPPPNPSYADTVALHWAKGINWARREYRMAARAAHRNKRWQALAHLEEAACQTCVALIILYTGHRQCTQTLLHLLKYCDNFCDVRSQIFPCNTPEEAQLLQFLEITVLTEEKDCEHMIPLHIVEALLNRVNRMLELADWLYREKMGRGAQKPLPFTLSKNHYQ